MRLIKKLTQYILFQKKYKAFKKFLEINKTSTIYIKKI